VTGAGSRIWYLRNLPPHLGPDQPIYALHRPPIGPEGHANRRVEDLASQCVAAIREVQTVGPYHLAGFSFGGPVAFEMAQPLTRAGETVALLALIDSRNPLQARPRPGHVRFLPRQIANQVRIVRRLGARVGARYLRRRATIARDRSVVVLREVLDRRLPVRLRPLLWPDPIPVREREWMAADAASYDRYRPTPYPGRLTFLWAEHDERPPEVFDARRGWSELALGGFHVRPIPGNHRTIVLEPLAGITLAVLAEALREAQADGQAVAPPAGFEPATRELEARRSVH
jgi:thioesterase domain-containing protein